VPPFDLASDAAWGHWYVLRRLGLRAFFAPAELSLPQMAAACEGAPAAEAL